MTASRIHDIEKYNFRMQQSLIDKIFFMDKIFDVHAILDFGCADGSLIFLLHKLFPQYRYQGFDCAQEMILKAVEHLNSLNASPENPIGIDFFHKWEQAYGQLPNFFNGWSAMGPNQVHIEPNETCLLLSSVIHEVYSYGPNTINEFWDRIFTLNPKYIVIRDMSVSKTASRSSDPVAVARIRQCFDQNKISQWEARWGSLNEHWSLVHFLLTYHYEDNWEREYQENYLPISTEDLLQKFPKHYVPSHIEHYTLPFLRHKVFKDFGVQLQEKTHLKLIMERA